MTGIIIRPRESWWDRIVGFRHVADRRDPSLFIVIRSLGTLRLTTYTNGVICGIVFPQYEQPKIAISACRLRHIDFHTDCRTIAIPIVTVDCDRDCNFQTHVRISGA